MVLLTIKTTKSALDYKLPFIHSFIHSTNSINLKHVNCLTSIANLVIGEVFTTAPPCHPNVDILLHYVRERQESGNKLKERA